MVVLSHNHEQLIIGADTRKLALLMVGGYILVCLGIYSLLSTSEILSPQTIVPVSIGLLCFLSLFVAYFFYQVFQNTKYIFNKKSKKLQVQNSFLFGDKMQTYDLDHLKKVELRAVKNFAYSPSHGTHHSDTYLRFNEADAIPNVVLRFNGKKEIDLNPNAAYFILHPFTHNDEVTNGLAEKIAKFLGVPFAKK